MPAYLDAAAGAPLHPVARGHEYLGRSTASDGTPGYTVRRLH